MHQRLLLLSKTERSAVISREWFTLIKYAPKEQLAAGLQSSLDLEELIKRLDELKDDQERMVKIHFPELNKEDLESKIILGSLNQTHTRAIESLSSLNK